MNRQAKIRLAVAAMAALLSSGAVAQTKFGANSDALLTAVREQNGAKTAAIVQQKGTSVINVRGYGGDTPLTVAMANRSSTYVSFLLILGAEPDFTNQRGETALLIAARSGFGEGVEIMLTTGANVGLANRQGETPLIVAVQGRHTRIVRMLLEAGATADTPDFAAGYSARDYARRDTRNPELLRLIETIKPTRRTSAGPTR